LCSVIRVFPVACVLTIYVYMFTSSYTIIFLILSILFDRMGVIFLSPTHFFHSFSRLFISLIYYFIFLDPSPERDTDNEAAEKERMWVMRGRNSAIAVTCGWITWILFVQVIFPDSLPSSWYVRDPNSFAATGW
jgi:hypothetical protein